MTEKRKRGVSARALLLLVDAGATHTRGVVAGTEGQVLGQGHAGPANAFAVGAKVALANLLRATRMALAAASVPGKDIVAGVVGSASVEYDGSGGSPLRTALRRLLPRAHLLIVGDSLIALEGALLGRPGVVILSGTGSVVLGKSACGKVVKVGGWGPLLGDEGSAQWVGRQALQAVALATDQMGPATLLTRAILRHFRLRSFDQIIDVVYAPAMTPAELGALAPLVARAAHRGDRIALDIFRRAGEALAVQAAGAVQQLGIARPQVSYQGAMFRVGRILLEPLRASLKRYVPKATLVSPAMPPIGGAFLLSLASTGLSPTPRVISAFRRNCHV